MKFLLIWSLITKQCFPSFRRTGGVPQQLVPIFTGRWRFPVRHEYRGHTQLSVGQQTSLWRVSFHLPILYVYSRSSAILVDWLGMGLTSREHASEMAFTVCELKESKCMKKSGKNIYFSLHPNMTYKLKSYLHLNISSSQSCILVFAK